MNRLERWMQVVGPRGLAVRQAMAKLAEPIINREPPFDQIRLPSILEKYIYYVDRGRGELDRIKQALVQRYQLLLGGEMYRTQESVQVLRPYDLEIGKEFARNYAARIQKTVLSGAEQRKTIISAMKAGLPEFRNIESGVRGILKFSKPNRYCEAIELEFDFGVHGPGHFVPLVSTADPRYGCDVSDIAGTEKKAWIFSDVHGCEEAMAEVLELLVVVLPVFEAQVEKGILSFQSSTKLK